MYTGSYIYDWVHMIMLTVLTVSIKMVHAWTWNEVCIIPIWYGMYDAAVRGALPTKIISLSVYLYFKPDLW